MTSIFNATVIRHIQDRIAQHNEFVGPGSDARARLKPLKTAYTKAYHGDHEVALEEVDRQLRKMAKAAGFDENKHPRGGGGRFTGQRTFYRDVASRRDDKALRSENSGYDAAQTAVIPETRYEVLGPTVATAAGVALGAVAGVTATPKGDVLDHISGKVLGFAGRHAGMGAAKIIVAPPIRVGRLAARTAIGAINSTYATRLPRPGKRAGEATIEAATRAAGKGGEFLGSGAVKLQAAALSGPPWLARKLARNVMGGEAGGLKARIAAGAAGAVVGAVIPGYFGYAKLLNHLQTFVGPYEDALFPRRVRKGDLAVLEGADVLAKLDAPFDAAGFEEVLAKAGLGDVARRALAALEHVGRAGIAAAAPRRLAARAGSRLATKARAIDSALDARFPTRLRQAGVTRKLDVERKIRARYIGKGIKTLTPLGTTAGGLAGLAVGSFAEDKHPRDEHGRFATTGRGGLHGAAIGAVAGAALGAGLGALTGNRRVAAINAREFANAASKISSNWEVSLKRARDHGERVHATSFAEGREPGQVTGVGLKNQTVPGPVRVRDAKGRAQWGPVSHERVAYIPSTPHVRPVEYQGALRSEILKPFEAGEGRAISGGPKAHLLYQLNQSFDRRARTDLGKAATKGAPSPTFDGTPLGSTSNLIDKVDPEKLNENQRKIWDHLSGQHKQVLDRLESQIESRRAAANEANATYTKIDNERDTLQGLSDTVPQKTENLIEEAKEAQTASDKNKVLRALKAHAKQHFGEVEGKSLEDVAAEVERRSIIWESETFNRIRQLDSDLATAKTASFDAGQAASRDFMDSDRLAVTNPFRTAKGPGFFAPLPDIRVRRDEIVDADPRMKSFLAGQKAHGDAAEAALTRAMKARLDAITGIQGGLSPKTVKGLFDDVLPMLAGRNRQANQDAAALMAEAAKATPDDGIGPVSRVIFHERSIKRAVAYLKGLQASAAVHARAGYRWVDSNKLRRNVLFGLNVASALGVIDIAAGKGKKKVHIDPRTWRAPSKLQFEHYQVDPARDPFDVVSGVSFLDPRDGQRKFLQGIHNREDSYTMHGFGVPVDAVKTAANNRAQQRRQQNPQQSGGDAQDAKPQDIRLDSQELEDRLSAALKDPDIVKGGDPEEGGEFSYNKGAKYSASRDAVKATFTNMVLRHLQRGSEAASPQHFYRNLATIMDSPKAAVLTIADRAALLTGGEGVTRGIFAVDAAYKGTDKNKIFEAIRSQIGGRKPSSAGEASLLKRAMFTLGEHYNLSAGQRSALMRQVGEAHARGGDAKPNNKQTSNKPAAAVEPEPPQARESTSTAVVVQKTEEQRHKAEDWDPSGLAEELHQQLTARNRNPPPLPQFTTTIRARYQKRLVALRTSAPGLDDEQLRNRALDDIEADYLKNPVTKADGVTGLRKFLAWDGQAHPRVQAGDGGGEFTGKGRQNAGGQPAVPTMPAAPRAAAASTAPGGIKPPAAIKSPRGSPQSLAFSPHAAPGLLASYGVGDVASRGAAKLVAAPAAAAAARVGSRTAASSAARFTANVGARKAALAGTAKATGGVADEIGGMASKALSDAAAFLPEAAGYALRGGVKLAAGAVGGAVAQYAADSIFKPKDAPKQSFKQQAVRLGGGIAGSVVGGEAGKILGGAAGFALGGPVGEIAGGALGGYLGDQGAQWAQKLIASRYGNDVARSTARHMPGKTRL